MNLRRYSITVAVLSSSIILLEIMLTRIFSVTLFHHFAFAAVSVGMLGLASAGIQVYLDEKALLARDPTHEIGKATFWFALSTLLTLWFCVHGGVSLTISTTMILVVFSTYAICLFPFFFGGKAVTLIFTYGRNHFGRLYACDLLAAGLSCFLVSPLLLLLGAPSSVVLISFLACLICLFVSPPQGRTMKRATWALALLCLSMIAGDHFFQILSPDSPKGNIYQKVLYERWNSFSRVAVYDQRTGPWALGPKYKGPVAIGYLLDIDASASTMVTPGTRDHNNDYLRYELTGAGYWGAARGKALIIGSGGGRDVTTALLSGMSSVDAVEINPLIVNDVMRGQFADFSGHLYSDPRVNVYVGDGRSFATRTQHTYDTIQLSLVDTWAATAAGAFALSESNLYTTEAAIAYIKHLNPPGILSVIRWSGEEIFRLVGILSSAARSVGIDGLQSHFLVLEGPSSANPKVHVTNVMFRRDPFDAATLQKIRSGAENAGFTLVYDPANPSPSKMDSILRSPDPVAAVSAMSDTDLRPSTDDWPFYFSRSKKNWISFGLAHPSVLLVNGEYLVAELLLLSLLFGALVLFLPLWRSSNLRASTLHASNDESSLQQLSTMPYFACIGVGFMLFEIASMQRFVLYLGHPTHSLTTVLSGLLLGAGGGSYLVSLIPESRRSSTLAAGISLATAVVLAVLNIVQPHIFSSTQALPIEAKILISECMILPIGILLGFLMPLGIEQFGEKHRHLVPWAWGINGLASVFGSCAAVLLGMHLGFTIALYCASAIYVLAACASSAFHFKHAIR